ncbi:dUTP diphosphatase [Raoultibacter massiliensis]|uniref:dUTP diphosphatase n=1 Tax=Raoultibacter massiliensis TaxID=1852371 RepID=UPI003A912483
MAEIEVPIRLIDSGLEMPAYAHPGDAGLDLRSSTDMSLAPFERALVPTGIAVAIPEGYAGFVVPRSGLAIKQGLSIVNAPGLIDSCYRGEIKIIAINLDPAAKIEIKRGDRVAQLVIMATPVVSLATCDQLEESERGAGGFGSSGSA